VGFGHRRRIGAVRVGMKAAGLWLMMEDFPFCAAAPIVPIFLVCY